MNAAFPTETRRLTVSRHIIFALIKAQAGTLAKAVLECVMNSIDAGATKIDIRVTNKTLQVVDDGKGFSTKKEILACFEVFGFEHAEGDRAYGQFGIGRAQLWNFCTTAWRTQTFAMDVDIKNKGLDYALTENLECQPGLSITGNFYTPLKSSEIIAFEREIGELATYCHVPVTVNGVLISKDPAKEKWTHETPEAWINIRESGNLKVYNLGVFVRDYPSYQVGSGGKVVTKPGVRLSVNMARNDILLTECKVWKKIKPFLQSESDKRIKNVQRKMTVEETDNVALRLMAGEVRPEDVRGVKFISDITGKSYSIQTFLRRASGVPLVSGAKGDLALDKVNQQGLAFVIDDATLARFNVATPSELVKQFKKMAKNGCFTHPEYQLHVLKPEDDSSRVSDLLSNTFTILGDKDLTKEEACALAALNGYSNNLVRRVATLASGGQFNAPVRKVFAGESEQAAAWTDGIHHIVFDRKTLALVRKGIPGVQVLINYMLHEYLHDVSSAGSHKHDAEFWENFHDISLHHEWGVDLGNAVAICFRNLMSEFKSKGIKMIKSLKDGIDTLDDGEDFFPEQTTMCVPG